MKKFEIPLVLFTTLTQMAVGILFFSTIQYIFKTDIDKTEFMKRLIFAEGILFLGIIFSVFHLGNPVKFYRSLLNLKTSWLSREILFISLLVITILLNFVSLRFDISGAAFLTIVTTLIGITFLYISAGVYCAKSYPAFNLIRILILFVITSILTGASYVHIFYEAPYLNDVILNITIFALAFNFLSFPMGLLSDQAVVKTTSIQFLKSPLFIIQVSLYISTLVAINIDLKPGWIFGFILFAEISERLNFFRNNAHTSTFIGQ